MSITGAIAIGLGVAEGIEQALAGAAVTIGGVGLTGLEIPATMPFGGSQMLAVHKLPGGLRVIDAMGPDEADIEWSGFFTGMSAVSRARMLDSMRKSGSQVTLTWADFSRSVIIKNFRADYGRAGSLLPYRISCVVITAAQSAAQPTLSASVGADLSSASGISGLASVAQTAITTAQVLMPVGAALTSGSAAFTALSGAMGTAQTAVSAASAAADGQLGSIASIAAASGQIFGGPAGLLAALSAQSAGSAAAQAAGFIGRAVTNLAA